LDKIAFVFNRPIKKASTSYGKKPKLVDAFVQRLLSLAGHNLLFLTLVVRYAQHSASIVPFALSLKTKPQIRPGAWGERR
jgi:hypothetical protein